ncbi:hypothetical protein BGW41_002455 [Actinomortierella wolfii]|nr:hypothetical protein BGW41_002455 [Actinomortierella wolfii]
MPLIHVLELMPDEASFVTAKEAIKERYVSRIQTLQNIVDGREEFETYEPLASEEAGCNYQIYMQLGAIDSSIKPSHLKELEKEWASPQGISTIRAPPLNASMIMYSPNCRLVMQAKEMKGMKIEKVYSKMLHYAVMAGIIAFIQVILLSKQMEFTLTPTSVSKVSYWTITIHSIMDANLFMVYYSTGATYDRLFLPFAAAAFFSCVLVSIFGMRYMYVIRRIQRPERRERRAASANSGSNTTTNTNGANSDGLPLPATARRPNSPSEGNQSRLDIQGFLQDNYLLMLFLVLILFQIASMFAILQTILFDVIMVVMYSFWVPQISRNAIRGSSKALTPIGLDHVSLFPQR